MKKSLCVLFIVAFATNSFSQSALQFASPHQAKQMVDLIVDVVGLKSNFEVKPGRVDNAAAVIYGGKRYIIYNPGFISQITNAAKTNWAGLSILAHEVGHHLNGHTLLGSGSTPSIELEADEFSGFVLKRLGASLVESQRVMKLISNEGGSSTHPGRSKRLMAIESGWKRAEMQIASAGKPSMGPIENKKPGVQRRTVVTSYEFPAQYIAYNVNLFALPGEQFVITKKNNFIRLTSKGYQVIGKLIQWQGKIYLSFRDDQKLRLTTQGQILDSAGQRIGIIRMPS